ncbi:hypothetical protein KC19_VG193100 [Ceratodon purpureus]|uniref:Uncharacterized protein n=1 Tax=Ceratodon purpureus TaxID=3225 RepID=A0A8T0HS28_CERPU|nr:hypothetical protein KC19_VG193100 [Ceratodon purpureus]
MYLTSVVDLLTRPRSQHITSCSTCRIFRSWLSRHQPSLGPVHQTLTRSTASQEYTFCFQPQAFNHFLAPRNLATSHTSASPTVTNRLMSPHRCFTAHERTNSTKHHHSPTRQLTYFLH